MLDNLEPDPTPGASNTGSQNPERAAQFDLARQLLAEQRPTNAIVAGLLAAVVGAAAWGAIGVASGASFSIVAVLLGAFVGYAVKLAGKGVTSFYNYVAGGFAILGCLAGNAALLIFIAIDSGRSFDSLLSRFTSTLGIMDLVFWLVAVYGATWFAKRDLSKEEGLAIYQYELHRPD